MAYAITLFVIFASLAFTLVFGRSPPTTIKTQNGQKYNCVKFYEQPAFRDHSLNLEVVSDLSKLQQQKSVNGFGLKSLGCPIGTVPILDRPNTISTNNLLHPPGVPVLPMDHCSAKIRTTYDANKKFFGAGGSVTIYNPRDVLSNQWSSSRIKLINGADSIEAGWMVNPNVFKDNETHLYASFTSVGGKGCINLNCSGFVQVSTDIPLGVVPHTYSTIGGDQVIWNLSIDKHEDDGNWWLSITGERHQIGYWPKNLFTSLAVVANQVEFGGEINDPGTTATPPSMGSGLRAKYDSKLSSCFFGATVVDESFNHINPPHTEKEADCKLFYSVLDGGYHGDLGRIIFYGGPVYLK